MKGVAESQASMPSQDQEGFVLLPGDSQVSSSIAVEILDGCRHRMAELGEGFLYPEASPAIIDEDGGFAARRGMDGQEIEVAITIEIPLAHRIWKIRGVIKIRRREDSHPRIENDEDSV